MKQKEGYSPEHKSKGFAPILILVGVLVVVAITGGAYFVGKSATSNTSKTSQVSQPTAVSQINPTSGVGFVPTGTDETTNPDQIGANWKTYTNTKYGFSFKYPSSPDWVVGEHDGPLGTWVSTKCNKCLNQTVDYFQVIQQATKSLDDYINNPVGTSDFTRMSLDGVPAVKAAYAGGEQAGGSSIKVFFIYKGQGYEIDMRYLILKLDRISEFPKANPDILPTFKFTN